MIRIRKPEQPPRTLSEAGGSATLSLCTAHEAGERTFRFKDTIYGASDVKAALIDAQHGKCCFCERKIFGDGDVEHFRPKAGVSQGPKSRMLQPGYYWLAYDWSNLLLSCSACNSRQKRNQFPLTNSAKRVRVHRKTELLNREEPLFIDPAREEPSIYIGFKGSKPFAIDDNPRGRETIRALGLDRDALNQIRGGWLIYLQQVYGALRIAERRMDDEEWREAAAILRGVLDDSQKEDAEFAAMARAAAANAYGDLL
jgi:uncharacterized protein (TIGR02646 family)